MAIDVVTIATMAVGVALLKSILTVARRAILIALVTLIFVISSATLLALSAVVLTGWWQDFTLELGVGLLIAGVVDIAILGALHGLIEGTDDGKIEIMGGEIDQGKLKKVLGEALSKESNAGYAARKPSGTGWPG
jgi:hypothetical protein